MVSGALLLINYIGMFWQSFLVIEIIGVFGGVAEELVQFVDMSAQTLNAAFSLQSALTQRFLLGEHTSAQLNLDTVERQKSMSQSLLPYERIKIGLPSSGPPAASVSPSALRLATVHPVCSK